MWTINLPIRNPAEPPVVQTSVSAYDVLVVGAGLAGSTIAERCAREFGASVLLIDRRPHLAGNCHDPAGEDGLQYHQYGPHVFHTNSEHVLAYLSGFTAWRPYEHRVLANVDGRLVPIPINRTTINTLYGLDLDEAGVRAFLERVAEPGAGIRSSEDVIVSRVGRELYERFFRGYTRKHWGRDPAELDASVCGRIPTRTNADDRYFGDRFQVMPAEGYTAMVERMTDHPRIERVLGVDYHEIVDRARFRHVVFTGPIDAYFGHRYGKLPYRSLRFAFETHDVERFQAAGCVNEPSEDVPYLRTTEYKHLTGQQHPKTIVSREYPAATGDPYYPIPAPESRELYRKYQVLAQRTPGVTFVGRLAEYRYYNMDQVVASALLAADDLIGVVRAAF
jgi:UDP-galactopyranose mutase